MTARYAIYYTPQHKSSLEALGREWLGRTAHDPLKERATAPEGFHTDEYRQLVESPRWYGFHGTLKAPFELAEGFTPEDIETSLAQICKSHTPFSLPGLGVNYFGNFFALTPTAIVPELMKLSTDCVRLLDPLRTPLSAYDFKRHTQKNLSERQERLLRRFGYPFVLEEFRFHMTLTGTVKAKSRPEYKTRLEEFTIPYLQEVIPVKEVTISMQPDRKTAFVEFARVPLTGK